MSGVFIGVDGKARKVKGGYIGVDGKARKIKKGYIGDANGVARLCWSGIDPVFANNSWESIIAVCQSGEVPESWAVGDQKNMTINGVDYAIDIIGKNHDDYADGSGKAPLTFQLHDCYITTYKVYDGVGTSGGWESCDMRTIHLPSILETMPADVRASIKEVSKEYAKSYNASNVSTTDDKLFLLSEQECFGTKSLSPVVEGVQYEYYKTSGRSIKYRSGTKQTWAIRSLYKTSSFSMPVITVAGQISHVTLADGDKLGVSFAFCF